GTSDDGHLAAACFSSSKAFVVDAALWYSTASVLSTPSPWALPSATCRRAVRRLSLGNEPLHRSSVTCPVTRLPPGIRMTDWLPARSDWRTTSPRSRAWSGSAAPDGAP